jgi:two-component sensor histidine kinase
MVPNVNPVLIRSLKKIKNNYQLIIRDNGIGISKDIELEKLESLGLKLVFQLTDQINGKVEIKRTYGTEFKILFKELKYKARI